MSHVETYLADLESAGSRLSEPQICSLFTQHILCGLLGYEASDCIVNPRAGEDTAEEGIPDLVITAHHNEESFNWIVGEAKVNDRLLRDPRQRERVWGDKRKYVAGDTVYFLWLASRTVLVADPTGKIVAGVYFDGEPVLLQDPNVVVSTDDDQVREHLDLISGEQARSLGFLERFRDGDLKSGYLALSHDTVDQLTTSLRRVIGSLRSYLTRRWNLLQDEYREYQRAKAEAEDYIDLRGDVDPRWVQELHRAAPDHEYATVKRLFEHTFPNFCRQQAYTRWKPEQRGQPEHEALADIFRTDAAYVILGRLLFVRFAEDQKDETGRPLITPKISNGGLKLWRQLTGVEEPFIGKLVDLAFTQAGSVFQQVFSPTPFDLLLSLDDPEFDRALLLVLYQLNAFSFERLERDLLGDLYQKLLPRDLRKKIGEFYTDIEVVEYILHRTGFVEAARRGAPTVLDPACGSGTFLVRAAYYLIEGARERGVSDGEILDLVSRCICGLDINDFAVFIARVNLLFICLDLMTNSHRDAAFQVHEANSLVGDAETGTYTTGHGERPVPRPGATPGELIRQGRYDFVVGNPPYVRIHRLPEEQREGLRQVYPELAHGMIDLATFFVARVRGWLNTEGTAGMIVPRSIADAGHASELRLTFVGGGQVLGEVTPLDWACHELFDSDVVPMVITWGGEPSRRAVRVVGPVTGVRQLSPRGLPARTVPRSEFLSPERDCWPIEATRQDFQVEEWFNGLPLLGDWAECGFGVFAGPRARVGDTAECGLTPMITGADIYSYWRQDPGRFVNVSSTTNPSLWRAAMWEDSASAFGATSLPDLAACCPVISVTINAAPFSPGRECVQDTATYCYAPGHPEWTMALLGLLNSSVLRWAMFVFHRAGVVGGGRRDSHFYRRSLVRLPTPRTTRLPEVARMTSVCVEAARFASVLDREVWSGALAALGADTSLSGWPVAWQGWPQRLGLSAGSLDVEREAGDRLRLSRSIVLTSEEGAVLDFLQRHLPLVVEEQGRITRRQAEGLPVPDRSAVPGIISEYRNSLERRDQAREAYLRLVEEIDEAVFDAFEMPDRLRRIVRRRMTEFPLNENAANYRKPWEPTRRPHIRIFEPGERYH